jgi:thioredoxin-like negative regulator of GroEL
MSRGILLFTAGWCEHCKVITPLLEAMYGKGMINFKKVNVDYDADTVSRYNVKSVPTIILTDLQGNEISRKNGSGLSENDIMAWYNG